MSVPDYSKYSSGVNIPGDNLMYALTHLADQQQAVEDEIKALEILLDIAQDKLKHLSEESIPQLLDGLEGTVKLTDGRTVTVKEKIRGNISSDKKLFAMKWLEDHDHGDIIKRRFIIEFNRDQENIAKDFEKMLFENGVLNVKKEQNVHWQTLDAFVREQLSEGSGMPLDLFGVYRRRNASIK